MGLKGLVHFRFKKKTDQSSAKRTLGIFGYEPKSWILFQEEKIGHIIGGKVYFYITVKHHDGEPENERCLNYVPELWGTFDNQVVAKTVVLNHSEQIWDSLDIYHSLKHQE